MSGDLEMVQRLRHALSRKGGAREVRMFGGLAFMLDGRMVVCASVGGADLLVRVAPERDAEHLQKAGARRAEMGKGRSMGEGWISVDASALVKDEDFGYWMDAALSFHALGSGQKKKRSSATR